MGKSFNKQKQSRQGADNYDRDAVGEADSDRQPTDGVHDPDMTDDDTSFSETGGTSQPQTSCAVCQTLFEVPAELLASNDTRVRCGECLSIFDALANLRRDDQPEDDDGLLVDADGNMVAPDSPYASAMAGANGEFASNGAQLGSSDSMDGLDSDISELDVTYSDFDLFSGEPELPEVAYFDQTQDTQHLRFDDPEGDVTFSDTLFSHDLTAEPVDLSPPGIRSLPGLIREVPDADTGFITDDVEQAPLDFRYRESGATKTVSASSTASIAPDLSSHDDFSQSPFSRQQSNGGGKWVTRSILAVLLIGLVSALYGYRKQDEMLQNPVLRPWIGRICLVAGCQLPPMVALDSLKVLKRSVFSHPTIENSLVIDLAFVNEAAFNQPYPVLEIRLTDRNGGLVIQNEVEPADYLDLWEAGDLLQSGERLDLSLIVEDPGQLATSFELKFR